jgi:ADP-ribosyl-[dinitrogen reductase] hydrolase
MTAEAPAADRVRGAVFGMMIADALAMPVHWYYTPGTIERDFGEEGIQNYQAPVHPHPDAFAWSMSYDGSIDIYHGVQKHIRTSKPPPEDNPHYHFGLEAGDVTLQMQLARVLMKCLKANGEEIRNWAEEFSSFMQTPSPALNNDIYRDVFIRRFFENLSKGRPLAKCPISQKECWSVGSMGGVIPALLTALTFAPTGYISILDCIAIHKKTHNSENVGNAAKILCPLLVDLCQMEPPKDPSKYQGDPAEEKLDPDAIDPRRMLILMAAKATPLPAVTGPSLLRRYNKARGGPGNIPNDEMYALHTTMRDGVTFDPSLYMDVPDENVIGRKGFLGTVCYTEHGVPAVLYLAYKYFDDPVLALKRNANLLGDSTSRGSLLGAILGAAHGQSAWPSEFVEGLRESAAIKEETDQFVNRIFG